MDSVSLIPAITSGQVWHMCPESNCHCIKIFARWSKVKPLIRKGLSFVGASVQKAAGALTAVSRMSRCSLSISPCFPKLGCSPQPPVPVRPPFFLVEIIDSSIKDYSIWQVLWDPIINRVTAQYRLRLVQCHNGLKKWKNCSIKKVCSQRVTF